MVDLLDHEKSRPLIEALPASLHGGPNRYNLIDPWGTPLDYLGPDSDDPRVVANDGRPVFVSAGPDQDFGAHDPACQGDNLRSDDPGPKGFRIHELRDALVNEETPERGGKKEDD